MTSEPRGKVVESFTGEQTYGGSFLGFVMYSESVVSSIIIG